MISSKTNVHRIGSVPPGAQVPHGMARVSPDTSSYDNLALQWMHFGLVFPQTTMSLLIPSQPSLPLFPLVAIGTTTHTSEPFLTPISLAPEFETWVRSKFPYFASLIIIVLLRPRVNRRDWCDASILRP